MPGGPHQQMVGPRPPVPCNVPQQPQNGSQQKTKVALQNMLNNRGPAQQHPQQQPPQGMAQQPPQPTSVMNSPPNRLQMINVQQQQQPQMMPQPQQMFGQPQPQPRPQQQFIVGQNMQIRGPHMQMPPGAAQVGMRYGPPTVVMAQRPPVNMQQVQRPPVPRSMFHGHDQDCKRKDNLCK